MGLKLQVRPVRLAHGEPVAQRLQAPLGEEGRLALLAGDEPHHVLVEPGRHRVGVDVGDEAVLVAAGDQALELAVSLHRLAHERTGARAAAAFMSRSSAGRRAGAASMPASCARLTSYSERRMARLSRCQTPPDAAAVLDLAVAVPHRAVGERHRPLERVQNGRGADLRGRAGELVAAVQPARGDHEPGALQLLEELADRGRGNVGLLGERGGGLHARRLPGERGQEHGGVIGEPADAQHRGTLPKLGLF